MRSLPRALRGAAAEIARPGERNLSGRWLWWTGQFGLIVVIVAANLIGTVAVFVLAAFVVPLPAIPNERDLELANAIAAAGYFLIAAPLGALIGIRGLRGLREWLWAERPATLREQKLVLRAPIRLFVLQATLWCAAATLFGALNATYSAGLGARVAIIVAVTGLVTASCAYLLSERILRPVAARALAEGMPERPGVPGVATRAVLAWALGTGLPLLGIAAIGILALSGDPASRHELAIVMVSLGGTGMVVGLLAVTVAARATADPIQSVRHALAMVQRGEFDVKVPVYDGTQIGQLQLGFNDMVGGLAERDRIREVFGTYVDPGVAAHVLEEGISLEGEEVEVTVIFVDVRDFTGFAERNSATEVVATINSLFERIVPIIHSYGGRVDKFIGDGLLAVFGAPHRQPDHADQALACALEIEAALEADADSLPIGIGLNSGMVVAGNVGGAGRLEFSVIGDAVNTAARVEAATRQSGDTILLAERTKQLLREPSPALTERTGLTLKGKTENVQLYALSAEPPRPPGRGS